MVGLSILSGSHIPLVEDLMTQMREAGLGHIPVIVGGIIPDDDAARLSAMGVARVYTPKDFELNVIMRRYRHPRRSRSRGSGIGSPVISISF